MKTWIILLVLFSTAAQASQLRCAGAVRGVRILVNAVGTLTNPNAGSGSVNVGGRQVARFEGEDVRLNYLTQSMRARNDQGDLVEARVTNLNRGTGIINRLVVRAYGISYSRVPVQCTLVR